MDIISWDEQLFLFLNNLGTERWDGFWMFVTNKLSWIPLYIVLAYLLYKQFGAKKLLITLGLTGLMVLCADQISHYYKDTLVQRLRPCFNENIFEQMRLVKDSCGGKYGFFSGHATNHFAIAIFLGLIFKSVRKRGYFPVLFLWASMIAFSRVYIGVHYPLDIFSGALIGSLLGLLFFRFWEMAIRKF